MHLADLWYTNNFQLIMYHILNNPLVIILDFSAHCWNFLQECFSFTNDLNLVVVTFIQRLQDGQSAAKAVTF